MADGNWQGLTVGLDFKDVVSGGDGVFPFLFNNEWNYSLLDLKRRTVFPSTVTFCVA